MATTTVMTFDQLNELCGPNERLRLCSDELYPGDPNANIIWHVRVPGRGVYMGKAEYFIAPPGQKYISMAPTKTFVPVN